MELKRAMKLLGRKSDSTSCKAELDSKRAYREAVNT